MNLHACKAALRLCALWYPALFFYGTALLWMGWTYAGGSSAIGDSASFIKAGDAHMRRIGSRPHRQQALSAYRQAVRLDPFDVAFREKLMRALHLADHLHPEMRGSFSKEAFLSSLEAPSYRTDVLGIYSNILMARSGRNEASRELWLDHAEGRIAAIEDRAVRLDRPYDARLSHLKGLAAGARHQKAGRRAYLFRSIHWFADAVRRNPAFRPAWLALSGAYEAAGDTARAREARLKAGRLGPLESVDSSAELRRAGDFHPS